MITCFAIAVVCWFMGKAVPVIGGTVFAILMGFGLNLTEIAKVGMQSVLLFTGTPCTVTISAHLKCIFDAWG